MRARIAHLDARCHLALRPLCRYDEDCLAADLTILALDYSCNG